ncbi:MAG: SpoIIIAH-like family protein [Ruminococcaceae bacterium]|nr:SpoIIIAH-like family protein [Oscillospiraceae bacterium]
MLKLKKPDTAELKTKVKAIVQKLGKRNLVILLSILVLGGAVWLNIALFSQGASGGSSDDSDAIQGGASFVEGEDTDASELPVDEVDSYFASAQVERKRSRDEAIEVLQLVVENPEALDESKSIAMAEISRIAADIDNEGKIESLVTAKGFDKCIAVISNAKCNVIVKVETALLPNQIAQIQEIVYEQSGILPANTKIIEKMG